MSQPATPTTKSATRTSKNLITYIDGARLATGPSFNAPATAIDAPTAGRVTSTLSTPRQFQFGVKFNF